MGDRTIALELMQRTVVEHLGRRDLPAAESACRALNAAYPESSTGWFLASEIALKRNDAVAAVAAIDRALKITPDDARFLIHQAWCLAALRRLPEALAAAASAERVAGSNAALHDALGTFYSSIGDQVRAFRAFDHAVALAPDQPHFLFNRATVERFLGRLSAAEADYDRVIALRPTDFEAYKNRTDLRTQTEDRNHIEVLQHLLQRGVPDWRGEVQIRYALAKEYEDLGRFELSFDQLARGARLRRQHMRYDVERDVSTVEWIMAAFPGPVGAPATAHRGDEPIFLVGLPRSGTTLVDRILSSHSSVHSAGELNHFAAAIVDAVRVRLGGTADPPRRELIASSSELDFAALGREYLARALALPIDKPRFTDKMPLNFLYCGIIRQALPGARIVHIHRHPMAACYAMFKTLFKAGYPFSYDLAEIGRYYIAYRKLMAHWHAVLPGAIHELSYERLVADQPGETRRLLDFCGLTWEDACLAFHRNPAATTTASASQVRQPMYKSSVEQWRSYAPQLAALQQQLMDAGVEMHA